MKTAKENGFEKIYQYLNPANEQVKADQCSFPNTINTSGHEMIKLVGLPNTPEKTPLQQNKSL